MANYNRLELTDADREDYRCLREHFPFRKWFIVKPEMHDTMIVDSLRKAKRLAKEHAPAAIYTGE